MKKLSRLLSVLTISLLMLLSGIALAAPVVDHNYQLVNSIRVGRTEYDYTYRVKISNNGPALLNVSATVSSSSSNTTIVDGNVYFGNLAAGSVSSSSDTFTIRQNRSFAFDPNSLIWNVQIEKVSLLGLPATVGAGLAAMSNLDIDRNEVLFEVQLGMLMHGATTVRLETSNPEVALVAADPRSPPGPFIDIVVPDGANKVGFCIHGMEGQSGAVTIMASAPGYATATGIVNIVQPTVNIRSLGQITFDVNSPNVPFQLAIGIPGWDGHSLRQFQEARWGGAGFTATVSSSDPLAAVLVTNDETGGTVTVRIEPGIIGTYWGSADPAVFMASGGIQLDPVGEGNTVLHASIEGFVSSPFPITITGNPTSTGGLFGFPAIVGAGLATDHNLDQNRNPIIFRLSIDIPNYGGTMVRVESLDSTLAQVAPDSRTLATPFFETHVASGTQELYFVIHGMEDRVGNTIIRVSAGDMEWTGAVEIVQPTVNIRELPYLSYPCGSYVPFKVWLGIPGWDGHSLWQFQEARWGGPGVMVSVASSNTNVLQLNTTEGTGSPRTVRIEAGYAANTIEAIELVSLAVGSANLSAVAPGYASSPMFPLTFY